MRVRTYIILCIVIWVVTFIIVRIILSYASRGVIWR